jgi:hypothetical protein
VYGEKDAPYGFARSISSLRLLYRETVSITGETVA